MRPEFSISRLWQAATQYPMLRPLGATTLRADFATGRELGRDTWGFLSSRALGVDVLRFTAGFTEFTLVNRPDLIQRILVRDNRSFGEGKWTQRGFFVMGDCLITQEGTTHAGRRELLRPTFARENITRSGPAMAATAARLGDRWQAGASLDIAQEMAWLALTAATETMFGIDLGDETSEVAAALTELVRAIPRLPLPRRSLLAAETTARRAAIRVARSGAVDHLRAQGLSDEDVVNEVVSLMIASVDTTPGTLTWAWLLLAWHPEVERRLHEELDRVLGGRAPTVEDLAELPYLRTFLAEVLRLYPPVQFIDRRALEDVDLDGHRVGRNDYLLLSPLLTHRDPRYHEDPLAFRPERWDAAYRRSLAPYAYFPFGGGPHVCIGLGLAEQEISLALATLAQRWLLRTTGPMPADASPRRTDARMTLERRA